MKQSIWNRLLSVMLAAAMLFSLISTPAAAWAAEEDGSTAGNICGENATWSLVDGVLTISGTGNTEHYEDESTTPWTDQRDSITKVVIESGITGIGDSLARCCTNLVDVEIPDTVTYVGGHAFSGCTGLTRITLPEGITRIGYSAFANTGLTVISLPSTVTQVEWNVFDGCTALELIVFTGDAPTFTPDAFVNVTTTVRYPENNTTWTSDVLQQYGGNITWEGYTLGAGGGEEDTCVEGEVCHGDSTLGVHICAYNFPDAIMENCVRTGFDADGDSYLSADEAAAVTNIEWTEYGIQSLEGIHHFSELQQLQCDGNQLTSLDLSGNTELIYVDCSRNQLTELDTGSLTKLEALFCYENNLTTLDLSANAALTTLNCSNNELLWLNLDNQSEMQVLNYQGQHHYSVFDYTQQDDVVWVDMTQFVGQENIGRITPDMEGATYDSATGIMTFSGLPADFPYNYELQCPAKPGEQMWVVVHYGCEHQWVESGCDRTCSVCGEEQMGVLHSFTRWTIYQLPTATEDGLCRKVCVNCGELNQTVIPAGASGVVDNSRNNHNIFETWLTDVNAAAEIVLTEAERNTAEQSLAWLTLEVESDYSNFEGSVMEQQWQNLENTLENGEWIQATFELKLQKQIGTDDPIQITDLGGGELSVSMLVEGWPSGDGVVYQVVYAGEGDCEVFDAQYDPNTWTLTFTTTKLGFHGITVYGAGSSEGSGDEGSNQETAPFENACSDSTEESLHICADNFPDETFRVLIQDNCDQNGDGYLSRSEAGVIEMHCAGMGIGSLEGIRHFSQLQALFCSDNPLTALDVSMLSQLCILEMNNTDVTDLDLSQNAELRHVHCFGCKLATLDLSSQSQLEGGDINGQQIYSYYTYTEGDDGCTIDMAQFVGADHIGRIEYVDGAEYNAETGIATFGSYPGDFWYHYPVSVGNGDTWMMEVYIHYGCEHQWVVSGCDRTCSVCGEEEIGALHSFSRWMIRELPTATTEGSCYRECTNCGEQNQTMIPAGMSGVVDNSRNNDNMFETWLTDVNAAAETVLTEAERNTAEQSLAWLTLEVESDYSNFEGSVMEQQWHNLENTLEDGEWIQATFELKLQKQIGTDDPIQITDLGGGQLAVSMRVEGWPSGDGVVYQVVFANENGYEVFDAQYDADNGILTFTTTQLGFHGITVYVPEGSGGEGGGSVQEADPFVTECPDSTEESLHICEHNFPDEAFRTFIQNNYDQDGDGYLSRLEAGAVTEMHCEVMGIGSLEGLKHFSQLQLLFCANNELTALDVTANPNIWWVNCNNNQISALNVSGMTDLEILYCGHNQLTSLDVSTNTALRDLSCPNNQLTELDVSNNPGLTVLGFEENSISFVDISMLTNLESLNCGDNRLTELDLSNKPNLRIVYCFRNELSALDVSASTELRELHFDGNNLTEIDLSNNTKLEFLNCSENEITQLDVNHLTNLVSLRCCCNWIAQLDVSGLTKLEILDCGNNLMEKLQLSNNTALKELHASYNLLTALDIGSNTELQILNVDTNMLQAVDLSNNTKLYYLNLRNNELSQVDVTMLTELTEALFCMNNLTTLDVSKNTNLRQLSFPENEITAIELSNNPELTWIVAYQNPLTAIDVSAQTKLEWLDVSNTDLTSLNLSSNTALIGLQCGGCKLTTLDLSNQVNLYNYNINDQWLAVQFLYTDVPDGYEVDIAQFVGADHLEDIRGVENASYDSATGIALFAEYPQEVVYHYDLAMATNPDEIMLVRVWNECDHQWEKYDCDWICSLCSNSWEDHDWGVWTVVELPTATTEGTKEKICSLCGAKWTDMISAGTSGILATTDDCVYEGRLTNPSAAGNAVLTDTEKTELENGSLAVLTLSTKEINNTVSKLETVLVMNTLENREEVCMYLDIQLYKQLGLNPVEQITGTGDTPVAISITVPDWLRNAAYTYHIIRVVDREVSVLEPAFYNNDSGELSFETDVFGTFVLTVTRPEEVYGELSGEVFWRISSEGWLCIYGNGAMPDYGGAGDAPWQEYANRITHVQVEGGITHIGLYAFSQFPNLREVYIADTVTSIGEGAFMNCEQLAWVSLAEVTEIGANAFRNCVALTNIHMPTPLQSIGNWAFAGCTALNFITFNGNAPSIGENAFAGVTATVSRPDGNESWTEDVMQQYGGTLTWNVGQGEDFQDIYADTVTWVEHFEDDYGIYRFTPERSHTYYFQSLSDDIPYGILVDSNDNVLAESDSENACFDFSCWLEAGQTYYLGIRTGGWGGGFDMIIRTQHSYQEEAVTEATCTVAGIVRFTCTECGHCYEGEYFADHSFGEDNTCTVCGALNGFVGSCGDDLTYTLVDGVVTISGTGDMWSYEWENSPFGYTDSIAQVIVEEGVTGIGAYAFLECYGLTSISLPSTLTTIGDYAFAQCHRLGGIELPESVTTIGAGAFQSMYTLTGITLPQGLTSIGSYAFSECVTLGEIQIPGSVTFIGDSAFRNCHNLSGIWVSEDNANYCSDSYGVLFDKGMTQLIKAPGTLSGEYTVPAGVNAICSNAFKNCHNLNAVILPEGVTEIREYAFANCGNLTSITLPSTLTTIGGYAFMESGLQEITIPAGVTSIADRAFLNSYTLRAIWVDADNTAYSNDSRGVLFNKDKTRLIAMPCALGGRYVIPDTVTEIGSQAFSYSKLTTVWVSGNVAKIPGSTFAGCNNLKEVVILGNVAAIRDGAFADCNNLQQILFLGDAPTFGYVDEETGDVWTDVFIGVTATVYYPADNDTWTDVTGQSYGGDLTWVAANLGTCGDDLIWIAADGRLTISGSGEMYDYSAESAPWISCYFTRAAILDGITHVSNGAFAGCMDMQELHFLGDAPTFGETAFFNSSATVYYPAGNTTWTEDLFQHYGGYMTWESYDAGYTTLPLDTEITVDVVADGTVLLKFTPAVTDRYYFCSVAGGDTYGTLYDINLGELASNDDDGSLNFGISYVMEAGQTYYLEVRHLNWEACTITVLAQQTHDCTTEVITEATCMQEGLLHHICNYCGFVTEETVNGDHTYGDDNICTVCGYEQKVLVADTEVTVDVAENEIALFKFTPTVTENYYFCSVAGGDTYGIIYNSNMEELVSNDDDGSQNFGITITVEAGTTIYLGARLLGGEAGTITVLMQIVHSYISETVTEATCTVEGLIRHTCEYCGDSYEESYLADHTYGEDNLCTACGDEKGEKGTCGDNLSWSYLDGVLTISGTGAMFDYQPEGAPWQQYMDEMTELRLEGEITYIGSYAFYNYTMWNMVAIPASVTRLGAYAFQAMEGAAPTDVYFCGDAPSMDFYAFGTNPGYVSYPYSNATWAEAVQSGIKEACGDSIILQPVDDQEQFIDMGAAGHDLIWILDQDYTLRLIGSGKMEAYYMADMPWCVYWNDIQRIELPDGLENIRHLSFCGITQLTSITIPSTVTELGNYAIADCANLGSIYFTGNAPIFAEFAFANLTATVYYPAGNDTWTEDVMQGYGGTITWVARDEGEDALFSISKTSVSLGDNLDMHFFVPAAYVADGCYAVITRTYADGREDHVVTVGYDDWNRFNDELLYVTYSNLAAKEMNDVLSVVIYDANGNVLSNTWTDSIHDYAMRMLAREDVITDTELRTVYVDMLNYGAAAQTQFGYDTEHLANADLTAEQQSYATASYETESNLVSGTGRAGTSLTLKNRITLDLMFSNVYLGADVSDLQAVISYVDHYGRYVEILVEGEDFKSYGSRYTYVSVPCLAIADYGQVVDCTIYDADWNVVVSAKDSIEGYAHRMAGKLPGIVDAIMKFGVSAYNYFH